MVYFRTFCFSLFCLSASAQSVISVRSGLVHFLEGSAFIDGRALGRIEARFPELAEGSVLRTEKGKVELLLAPGVFLRIGEDTEVRMICNSLLDTRVELVKGAAILQAGEQVPGNSVMVTYGNWQVRSPQRGLFRIDSEPPQIRSDAGDAEILSGGKTEIVNASHHFSFSAAVLSENTRHAPDALDLWSKSRSIVIAPPAPTRPGSRKHPGQHIFRTAMAPMPHR